MRLFLMAVLLVVQWAVVTVRAETVLPDETGLLDIGDDLEVTVHRFGRSATRVLWFPSETGFNTERVFPLARKMAGQGLEVHLFPLHEDYFIAPGRNSLNRVPASHIAAIIRTSVSQHPQDPFYLFSAGRGAALVATGLAILQEESPDTAIAGLLLMHPNFTANTVEPGQAVEYLPVTTRTYAPVYIFQPEKSGRRWYLESLVEALEQGGSQVLTQLIADAGEGYLSRSQYQDDEAEQAAKFPSQLVQAIEELQELELPARKIVADSRGLTQDDVAAYKDTLQPYPGNELAPVLSLPDMEGRMHDLKDYRGKVVLLNFWASWCPSCVHEIPSLGNLQAKFSPDDFVVLSVDLGEEKEEVAAFLERVPADYPVMLDIEGTTVQAWKLSAFPTTFVLDREGYIRLAYFGGLEWDQPDVLEVLEATFGLQAQK
ncbi:MAG: TlpA disulfide reductase family protein [Thiolinea sp.]